MTLKKDLKIFTKTTFISTLVFFVFGNIIFKGLLNYGDWTLVLFLIHIILTFIVMMPLLFVFWLLDKIKNKKLTSVINKVGLRTTIGTFYISSLLLFSIFNDTNQRLKDPYNYYTDLKYLGIYTLITILTFSVLDYYYAIKEKK
jgi:hypothetical protein